MVGHPRYVSLDFALIKSQLYSRIHAGIQAGCIARRHRLWSMQPSWISLVEMAPLFAVARLSHSICGTSAFSISVLL